MDIKRAKAIIESTREIEVQYNGQSVWLEGINEINSKVEIKNHKSSKVKRYVDVDELIEMK
ncbi:small, acid-soluble spore protein, H family [Serpentinicella alkaliphila]|uniref:H-type small acid-soluble spore protein n=1 Tax=Serpentinicella alkaliphila TaxID=1734049 RepID=A0A4R2TQE2_9FIRM|nr:small, acid-soluble spore protein, H family [Serpentinicella alkaliphila]QUH25511.1 small, acid-soluble spore protein, H family [Serpentinicella alkaliphila]TCP99698.1 H-type small acid-soluble spore protein [Serpentinicella alkaliphila]